MPADLTIVVLLAGAACAGFAQGVSGFAFSLVALSFWGWLLAPDLAAPLAVFGALLGQAVALPFIWRGFSLAKFWPLLLGGLAGVPIGAMLLRWVDADAFKLTLGLCLLGYCSVMLMLPADFHVRRGGRLADGASGLLGGIMGGLAGMSGPATTLWTTLRGWDKNVQRGVLQAFNIAMHLTTLTTYALSGMLTSQVIDLALWTAPAVAIPALCGVLLFMRISTSLFRRIIMVLVLLSGAGLVMGSLAF